MADGDGPGGEVMAVEAFPAVWRGSYDLAPIAAKPCYHEQRNPGQCQPGSTSVLELVSNCLRGNFPTAAADGAAAR